MAIVQVGSFTATGNPINLNIVSDFDFFELFIQGNSSGDNWDSSANPGVLKRAWFYKSMTPGTGLGVYNTAGAATDTSTFITTNGFSPYDQSNTTLGPVLTGASISQANPGVVTVAGHGYVTGNIVRLTNTTGMMQLASYSFNITRTGANTFTIPVDTSGFAAAATNVNSQLIPNPPLFAPDLVRIVGMTVANPMVVSTNIPHGYTVGAYVRLNIPNGWGMTQANGLLAQITAVTANTFTTNINSTAFTAFAFPVSATFLTPATVTPVGEIATVLTNSETNTGFRGITLGGSVCGPSGAFCLWIATKADAVQSM